MATDEDDRPPFATVDWTAHDARQRSVSRRTAGFLVGLAALASAVAYDYAVVPSGQSLIWGIAPSLLDWLSALAVLVLARYGVVPLAANPALARRYWARLRRRPFALVALAYLVAVFAVGVVGPHLYGPPSFAHVGEEPTARGPGAQQPPAFASVPADSVSFCAGPVTDGRCHGTAAHPLGTTVTGEDVLAYLVAGAGVAVKVALVAGVLLVPLSALVGTAAAAFGGRVDAAVVAYLDLQQVVPGVLAYLLYQFLFGPSLVAIVVLFGVLDWDRVARQVRADAVRKTDAGYVRAARSAGGSTWTILRRHLLPNVANTVVAAVTLQIPFILVAEVTLTMLGLVRVDAPSWGVLIGMGFQTNWSVTHGITWWSVLFPLFALVSTTAALAVVGDAMRDVLDPRGEPA